jgi:hypothetical protein
MSTTYRDLANELEETRPPKDRQQVALSRLPNSKPSEKPKRFFSAVTRRTDYSSTNKYEIINSSLVKDL